MKILTRSSRRKRPKPKKAAPKRTSSPPPKPRRQRVNVIDGGDGPDDYAAPTQPRQPRFRFVSASQVIDEPRPDYLVEGFLLVGALFAILGKPETCKSLAALLLAVCVASRRPFADLTVNLTQPRSVVIICAEGQAFMGSRLRAIREAYDISEDDIRHLYVFKGPVALNDRAEVLTFIQDLRAFLHDKPPAALIVIDTLTRCLGRGAADENSAKDTAVLADHIDRIKAATGAAVGFIDHVGKTRDKESRGHVNKHANVDWEVLVTRDPKKNQIKLSPSKGNHSDPFEPIFLMVEKHADAVALLPFRQRVMQSSEGKAKQKRKHLLDSDLQALRALVGHPEGLSQADWQTLSEVKLATLKRARARLQKDRLIRPEGPERRPRWLLTDEGERVAAPDEAES